MRMHVCLNLCETVRLWINANERNISIIIENQGSGFRVQGAGSGDGGQGANPFYLPLYSVTSISAAAC